MADVEFTMNRAGIREIFCSPEMQAVLKEEAENLCNIACARAEFMTSKPFKFPPYQAYTRVLRGTAVAGVSTASKHAERFEARNQVLISTIH